MLFEIARSLRSLTRSPFQTALNEARRMARRHREAGGPVGSTAKRAEVHRAAEPFVLPVDIEPLALAQALRAKLEGDETNDDALYPLEQKKLGGRVVLRGRHILRLGDGRYDEGRAYLHWLIKDQRARRWRKRFAVRR